MCLILEAASLATRAHAGISRKFTGEPYIHHPMRVAGRTMLIPGTNEFVVAAAWLHDVVEDVPQFAADLMDFPLCTFDLVRELTNPSTWRKDLNRAARKQMDRDHLANVSYWAKVIKLLDRIDNINDLALCERDFQELYAKETALLLEAIWEPNPIIQDLVDELREAVESMQWTQVRRHLGNES